MLTLLLETEGTDEALGWLELLRPFKEVSPLLLPTARAFKVAVMLAMATAFCPGTLCLG